MDCPICKNELKQGEILCPHGRLKWIPKGTKLFSHESKSIGVEMGFLTRAYADANYCPTCKKIIIDNVL